MKDKSNPYKSTPNFVLRTPLFPLSFFSEATKRSDFSNAQIKKLLENPVFTEALFLASPSLYSEVTKLVKNQLNKKREEKTKISVLKYLARMSSRATPFGLFAGCAVGTLGKETKIITKTAENAKRKTDLDMNYLVALAKDLAKKKHIKCQLLYHPNTSLYKTGKTYRFVEYYYLNNRRLHRIIEVDYSIYLERIIQLAKKGVLISDLVKELEVIGIEKDESLPFIEEIIDSQLLLSDLEPSLSGPPFMNQIIDLLKRKNGLEREVSILKEIQNSLDTLDRKIGNPPIKYYHLSEKIKQLETTFDIKHLYQADLKITTSKNTLSYSVIDELKKGINLLNKLTPRFSDSNLSKFKTRFVQRYETREMPLATVLDTEIGIGYLQDGDIGDTNPLIDDLLILAETDVFESKVEDTNKIHQILFNQIMKAHRKGVHVISLKEEDFEAFPSNWDDLPDSMSTMIQLVNVEGQTKISCPSLVGPTAARLFSRFCHGSKEIQEHAYRIAQAENSIESDKITAEILHLPEARVGNILCRPQFRHFEIPFMSKSLKSANYQLTIDDLYLSFRNNKLVLRSKKHNKEVIPRLTNAHNYLNNSIPIYHFLCDLQNQGMRNELFLDVGPVIGKKEFIPRIEYDRLILFRARWSVPTDNIKHLLDPKIEKSSLMDEVTCLRKEKGIPKLAVLQNGDRELLINFHSVTSVLSFLDSVKYQEKFVLREFLFNESGIVKDQKGNPYSNQLIISFLNARKTSKN